MAAGRRRELWISGMILFCSLGEIFVRVCACVLGKVSRPMTMRREMYVLLFAPWSRLYAIRSNAQRYQQKRLLSIRFGSVRFHVACCQGVELLSMLEERGPSVGSDSLVDKTRASRLLAFLRQLFVPHPGAFQHIVISSSSQRKSSKTIIVCLTKSLGLTTSSFPERTKLHAAPQAREDQPSNKFPCTAPTCPNLQTSCQTHCNIHCTRRAGIRIALLAGHQPCLFPSKQASKIATGESIRYDERSAVQ